MKNNRNQHWFTVTLGHSCYWCRRWVKIGERAFYTSHGDCGQVRCVKCANEAGIRDEDFSGTYAA